MDRRVLVLALAAAVVALYLTATVAASFTDGFDTNQVGTVSPFPWQFSTNNSGCWSGEVSDLSPLSPPNDYLLILAASSSTCTQATGNYGAITAEFNASNPDVSATVYLKSVTPSPHGLLEIYFELSDSVSGTVSTTAGVWTGNSTYVKLGVSAAAAPENAGD